MEPLRFGLREVPSGRALVMAIINRTRDSFYDHVATFDEGAAMAAVDRAVADGAEGARVFRAHQVPETRKVLAMVASIAGTRPPARVLRALA